MVSNEEIRRLLEERRKGEKPHSIDESATEPTPEPSPETTPEDVLMCPNCQTENSPDAKFCVGCGETLDRTEVEEPQPEATITTNEYKVCPSCNQKNKPEAKFCIVCGHRFDDETREELEEEVGGELEEGLEEGLGEETETTPDEGFEESESQKSASTIPEIKVPEHLKREETEEEADVPETTVKEFETAEEPETVEEPKDISETDEEHATPIGAPETETIPQSGVSEDSKVVDPVERIKNAKELLDLGAITQEEFDQIKNKYLKKI